MSGIDLYESAPPPGSRSLSSQEVSGSNLAGCEPGMLIFFCFYVVKSFKESTICLHLGGADFRSSGYFSNISKLNGRSDIYSQNTQNCELKELYMKLVKTGRSLEIQNL